MSVTPERKSILGNYQFDSQTNTNKISVNGTLNPYNFLITLLHEIAHCICFTNYRNKVLPHGKEWQQIFSILLEKFIAKNVFPEDIIKALHKNLNSPKASSCSDAHLLKTLSKYDTVTDDSVFVESIEAQLYFTNSKGQIFKKLDKQRTRYICEEIKTGKKYLFPALYKVKIYNNL